MCAALGKSLQNPNQKSMVSFVVTKDAKFSQIFGQNKVFPQVLNFIYNNASDFILLFS